MVDLVVVGCGAGGSTLLQRMARRGWRVVGLDAGPFWDPDADWVSDEAGSHHLYWTEPRVISGSDPVPMGSNNSGRGVGGSMVHYAGYTPRFHPSDFATLTNDGVGADWPLRYEDLRPYYEDIEDELPVAGEDWPWGDPHGYPQRPHPVGGNGEIFLRGAYACGITAKVGPVAISNGRFGNRPHCIYRGFCLQGCKVNAKASPLITHIPDALAHGAEIRANSMVTGIGFDERTGRATGVHYVRGGVPRFQRAAVVAVAGYSIETPRLLLNSASRRFPDGLGNDFDQVGRYLMVQGAPQTAGRFDAEVRMYKSPPPEVSSEEFYETDPGQAVQAGLLHPDRLAAAHHLGRARGRAGPLGGQAAPVHERLRALVLPGRAVRVPGPARQPGHPGRGEGPLRPARRQLLLLPVRQRQPADAGRAGRHGADPARGRAPTRSSPSTATPTWSAAPGWPPTSSTASSTATAAASPSPTSTSPTAACCPPRAAPTRP